MIFKNTIITSEKTLWGKKLLCLKDHTFAKLYAENQIYDLNKVGYLCLNGKTTTLNGLSADWLVLEYSPTRLTIEDIIG